MQHGSLYPALHRLEERGWVSAKWETAPDRNREFKYYRLTEKGKKQLVVEESQWKQMSDDPHQHLRLFLPVYVAFPTLRTAVAVRQLLVLDVNLPHTTKCLCSIAAVSGGRRRVGICLRSRLRVFLRPNHRTGLLCIAGFDQHRRQSMQRVFEFAVIGLAQRRLTRSVQHPVQLLQVHVDAPPGLLHAAPPSSSRKRFVNGYPRTSLIDRFGT